MMKVFQEILDNISLAISVLFYVLSISFQIAGAMLLVKGISDKPEDIACQVCNEYISTENSKNSKIDYLRRSFAKQAIENIKTKWALSYVIFGFVLGAFGSNPFSLKDDIQEIGTLVLLIGILTAIMYFYGYNKTGRIVDESFVDNGEKIIKHILKEKETNQ